MRRWRPLFEALAGRKAGIDDILVSSDFRRSETRSVDGASHQLCLMETDAQVVGVRELNGYVNDEIERNCITII